MSNRPTPRRHRRFNVDIAVKISNYRTSFESKLWDISESGMSVRSDTYLDPYSLVHVTIPMPLAKPLALTGMVMHQEETIPGSYRIGIQLQFFGHYTREPWNDLIGAMNWRAKLTDPPMSKRKA